MTTKPPAGLSRAAKRLWSQVAEEIQLDSGSEVVLQLLCEATDRRAQARADIRKNGATFRDRFGQMKPSPWCAIERDAGLQVLRCYHALGLDLQPPQS
jgi:P27 family predicted phage terminase small subunit